MHHLRSRCNTTVQLFTSNFQLGVRATVAVSNSSNNFSTLTLDAQHVPAWNHHQWSKYPREKYNQRILSNSSPIALNLYSDAHRRNIHDSAVIQVPVLPNKIYSKRAAFYKDYANDGYNHSPDFQCRRRFSMVLMWVLSPGPHWSPLQLMLSYVV